LVEINNDKIVLPHWSYLIIIIHLFVIEQERDELQSYLSQNGIQTVIHYPIPPHKQKALKTGTIKSFQLRKKIHDEVLSLPISPVLTMNEVILI
jgi:dTDP-4-amino-4,6-dideoxygalactose transaminase